MTVGRIDPVVKQLQVRRPVEECFRLFTEGIGDWWPVATHSVGGRALVAAVVFDVDNRKIVERHHDGTEHVWGELLELDPPRRFVATWHAGTDPAKASELEVTFTAAPADAAHGGAVTIVRLEHRGWERMGDAMRTAYDLGWPVVLDAFARHVEGASVG